MLMNFDMNDYQKKNLYEIIADELEKTILQSPDMVGTRLPSEQTYADQFGVSRNIIRESFKILQERGLLQIKNGDGSYISKPQSELFTQQIKRMVSFSQTDLADLYEVRILFEKEAAAILAERITDENIAKVEKLAFQTQEYVDDPHNYVKHDLDFHCQIIKSSENGILYSLYKPIASALGIMIPFGSQSESLREAGVVQHIQIAQAIKARNKKAIIHTVKMHIEQAHRDLAIILKDSHQLNMAEKE